MCCLLDICVVLVNILNYGKNSSLSGHPSAIHLNCFMKDGFLSCYGPDCGQNNL